MAVSILPQFFVSNKTFYISTTGNDSSGDGSVTSPWLTISGAISKISNYLLPTSIGAITLQLADGTYATSSSPTFSGSIIINGNASSPSNVILSGSLIPSSPNCCILIQNLYMQNTFGAQFGGQAVVGSGIRFTYTGGSQIYCLGGQVVINSNYSCSGSTVSHISVDGGFLSCNSGITLTLVGTPAYSNAFVTCGKAGVVMFHRYGGARVVFSGSATGTRYSVGSSGVIDTNGGGATYLPGSVVGSGTTYL